MVSSTGKPWCSPSGLDIRLLALESSVSKIPSSCARVKPEPSNIHDIRSERRAGSMTSSSHLLDADTEESGLVESWCSGVLSIIKSESHPSLSGGKCRDRGCHSDITNRASIVPTVRVLALEPFSCPSITRIIRC